MDSTRIQDTNTQQMDAETVEKIRAMVKRLSRKVESIIDPETRDGLEDATGIMLAAVAER